MTTMNETKTNLTAKKWQRIIAWIIDSIIIGFFILVANQSDNDILAPIIILFSYYFIMEVIWDRTFGKLIMGIMIVDARKKNYEEKRMIKLVLIRTLCRYIPFDLISFFFTDNGQLWHDNLSNTIVICRKSRSETYVTN